MLIASCRTSGLRLEERITDLSQALADTTRGRAGTAIREGSPPFSRATTTTDSSMQQI